MTQTWHVLLAVDTAYSFLAQNWYFIHVFNEKYNESSEYVLQYNTILFIHSNMPTIYKEQAKYYGYLISSYPPPHAESVPLRRAPSPAPAALSCGRKPDQ